jgi:putative ABC transport system substrate-binding protein
MRRRELITLIGAAAAWPIAARAQQAVMPVIGLLSGAAFEGFYSAPIREFRLGLKETGFVEGQNVAIEYRTADGHPERLRELAADLVSRQVAVIVAMGGSNSALAAKAVTATIPIVFAMGGDAVDLGLVRTLSRPEANVTGMSFTTSQLAPKRLDLLRELVPQAELIGYLDNVATSSALVRNDLMATARSIGRQVLVFYAGTEREIDAAFDTMARQRTGALVISTDAYLASQRDRIVSLAEHYALPTIYPEGYGIERGLISYGTRSSEMFHQAGIYAGRILRGAKPADLPVMLPTKFELVINLKTAKALGLTIPPSLLAIADEVIE